MSVAGVDCYPHKAEATKRQRIEEESRLKGVPVADHPGWKMWLCGRCGVWHEGDQRQDDFID